MIEPKEIDFASEIHKMMFGLGDCRQPLLSTASFIETFLKQQMAVFLTEISEISNLRGSSAIELQDILFFLRKDYLQLKRLIQYLEFKDTKMGVKRLMEEMDPIASLSLKNNNNTKSKTRKETAVRFLNSIGVNVQEIEKMKDPVKNERMVRCDLVTRTFDEKSYMEYHKSRSYSFNNRVDHIKLVKWLDSETAECVSRLKKDTFDVILYLAKEMVAEIIDLALQVRRDYTRGEEGERVGTESDYFGDSKLFVELNPDPISVDEVREVIRRCMSPQMFPFASFNRNSFNFLNQKLLFK